MWDGMEERTKYTVSERTCRNFPRGVFSTGFKRSVSELPSGVSGQSFMSLSVWSFCSRAEHMSSYISRHVQCTDLQHIVPPSHMTQSCTTLSPLNKPPIYVYKKPLIDDYCCCVCWLEMLDTSWVVNWGHCICVCRSRRWIRCYKLGSMWPSSLQENMKYRELWNRWWSETRCVLAFLHVLSHLPQFYGPISLLSSMFVPLRFRYGAPGRSL